jgi:hypothetical protein
LIAPDVVEPLERDDNAHAIIRGANGRRHEVDFGDAPVRVEIYASEETVEIFIEADFETLPEERRRFALINFPATRLAKPPPQRRDVPQNPVLVLDVLSDFGTPVAGPREDPR